MKHLAFYIGALAVATAVGWYLYAKNHPAPKSVFTRILSLDELKAKCDALPPRAISRPEDMQQALSKIVQVFLSARQNSIDLNSIAEIRFYLSPQTQDNHDSHPSADFVYNSLQAFQVNTDSTRSPLGERVHLPENIVFYIPMAEVFQEFDMEKKIMCMPTGKGCFTEIVLYNIHSGSQIPLTDRSFLLFDDKIYEAPDEGLLRQFDIWRPTPDVGAAPSLPVRP